MSQTPCADRSNDPNDWFIRSDGKQYSSDDFLTEAEQGSIARSVLRLASDTPELHKARVDAAISAARGARKRVALAARQAAKSKCYSCPVRIECMSKALDNGEMHGTWGGYFEEEIAEIRNAQSHRRSGGLSLLD